jgi:hypothetical protein
MSTVAVPPQTPIDETPKCQMCQRRLSLLRRWIRERFCSPECRMEYRKQIAERGANQLGGSTPETLR